MKTFLLTIVAFIILTLTCSAQTPFQVTTTSGNTTYVYVGSLTRSSTDADNSQKIVIKILGGSWGSSSDAETAFYISNRGGLVIKKTSLGGSPSKLGFKAYQNGANIDFYIVPDPTDYTSFAVTSYVFGYFMTPQFVNITTQSTAPTTTDITSSATISSIMMTDGNGNIGIGTASPDAKLAVQGTIHSTSVLVDTHVPTPDYVFKDGYRLPTLAEVKAYTDKNHHLPEVPAAAEFEKHGINLGEMNMVLLKKVEELTLYLMEQNKKITDQQKQIDDLKKSQNNPDHKN